jgi:NAD dependent epimerase/dehydratase
MTVLVTGAGGFIGSHLTEALLARGESVRALVHYNGRGSRGFLDEVRPEWASRLDIRQGDVRDAFLVRELVEGCDAVFHLAALIGIPYSYVAPASYLDVNVSGTLNVLEASRHAGVRRVIVTSTSEVYGTARYTPIDEAHPLQGQSPYSASKIAADHFADAYRRSFDVPVVVVRPFNTYGPRQSARAVIPSIAAQIAAGREEIRLGSLWPERDLTFVEDTAAGFVEAARHDGAIGQVINLGSGRSISVGALAERMVRLSGSTARILSTAERQRPERSEVGVLMANAERARALLAWAPAVGLDQGLMRTIEYVQRNIAAYRPEDYAR